ncbi:MAG: HEPN domain-containing protein [Nanoarchaeota archaeon]
MKRLKKEGKIKLVEQSDEISDSYISKSESNISSSKILLENDKLEESVALTYYSMYHMLTALLFKIGIKCENHTASIILLKEIFKMDNSDILNAKEERIDKQYYTDFHIVKEEIFEAINDAEEFNSKILDFISKLTNDDIKNFRETFKELINDNK